MAESLRGMGTGQIAAWQVGCSPAWLWALWSPCLDPSNAGKALQLLLLKIQVVFDFASAGGKGTEILGPFVCCISKHCSFSLKRSKPVISSLLSHVGNRAHPLCRRQAACFQAWSLGQLPVACSSCWYRSLSARHSSIMRKINMKTSLTASVLFHPAPRSLGRGGESPQGDPLTPNCSMPLLFFPLSARGLLSSPLAGDGKGSSPAVRKRGGAPGLSLWMKGWGRWAQPCAGEARMPHHAQPFLPNFLLNNHFPNGYFRAFQKSQELSVVIVTDPLLLNWPWDAHLGFWTD